MNLQHYSKKRSCCLFLGLLFSFVFHVHSMAQINFATSSLSGAVLTNPTSLQFGPDGRLYVSQQNGIIKIFTVVRNSANNYSVTATETISLINQIPNHNDDGTLNSSVTTRQVTGILVAGTASQPLIYVTSSDSRIGGGSSGSDLNLDTNSGIISLLTWNGSTWTKMDLVRGLPRSEENHSPNGIQLDPSTNTLYVTIGGSTNAGSPSNNFGFTCEYALSAAILSIDLNAINAMSTKGSGNTAFKYDLPTVDDPTRTNSGGVDVNDPFGGNDGLNQARIVTNGPVKIFSPGYRNAYDLVITKTPGKAGRIYTIDNGANQGWGGYPENEGTPNVTNNYVTGEPGSTGPGVNEAQVNNLDGLHYIGTLGSYVPGSYYGGHPVPIRANPSGAGLYTRSGSTGVFRTQTGGSNPLPSDWPPVPTANPIEGDFQMPGSSASGTLLTFTSSTNGLTEYTASNFNNALKGNLLAAAYDGAIYRIMLTADGTNVTNAKSSSDKVNQEAPFASGFGSTPLDVIAQGDNDIFPGSVWAATYGANAITIFEPADMGNCTGQHNSADDDGDGYTNADEMDNGTNPCSAASKPNDFDHDFISDLNDPDDDNDGIADSVDVFPIDVNNGITTNMPLQYELLNNNPGTGFFGLGFTGLMSNKQAGSNYLNNFDPNNLVAGGAVGAFTVVAVSAKDALGTLNNQENAFQFGVNSGALPFTIQARMLGPFFSNQTPSGNQSQGIYIGTGDQSNYLKISLNANGGQGGIQIVKENADVPVSTQFSISGGVPASTLDLYLGVNPATGMIQPKYASDGGSVINAGPAIQVSGALLNALQSGGVIAVGIISTSINASPFTATWDYIYVTKDSTTSTGSWQTLVPSAGTITAREENAYVQAGNKFYLMGGRGIVPVQEYEPLNKTWTNKAGPPIELNHFQALTLDGLIYAVCAFNGPFPHEVPVSQVYMYDPVGDKWMAGSTIPQARRRGSAGAAVYKNKIYMVGGLTDGHWSGWVNWFDEYDPATNTWKTLPNAPRERDHFHVVVVNDKLYVAGGRRSSQSTGQLFSLTIPEVDVYDFITGQWSTLPSSSNIPTQRAGASNGVIGNEVIVIGGENTQPTALNQTEALNTTTNTWRTLANLQQGRHGTQAIVNNDGIYIASGAGSQGGSNLLTSQEAFYFFTPTTPNGLSLSQSQLSAAASLDFGTVTLNTQSTKKLTLSNTGNKQAIMISSIALTGSGAFTYSSPYTFPFVIPPGKSVDINVTFGPAATGSQSGSLVVTHSGQVGSSTTNLTGQGSSSSSNVVYRINAGGQQVNTSIGSFAADNFFSPSPGFTYATNNAIAGTTDDTLYQTERSSTTTNGTFSYAFPVSNGSYTVVLHFAEIFQTAINKRVFDVSIENVKVLDNYDIFKKVGGFTATTETFTTNVSDGTLNIDFSALVADGGIDRPKVSAIEILNSTATNTPPTAIAGQDQIITLPVNSVSLNGSGTDDGSITAYSWTKVSGPAQGTITSPTSASTTVTGLVQGTYTFRLTVTDNGSPGLTGSDDVVVTVNPATTGQAVSSFTLVNADNEQDIQTLTSGTTLNLATLPTKNLNIRANTSPTTVGSVVFNLSGASAKTVTETTAPYSLFGDNNGNYNAWTPVVGNYTLKATPFTGSGGTGTAGTALTVGFSVINQTSGNTPPTANAGQDQIITLPTSSVTLNGSGTDTDGVITAYSWTKVSGPAGSSFGSPTSATTSVNGLVQGSYVFRLTVTDDKGATGSDDVGVTVNAPTQYRINAGGPQLTTSIGSFAADNYFSPVPGVTFSTSNAIAGTTDDALYQTERSSNSDNGTFSYAFPVSNGVYTVVLHFAEISQTAINKRVFDVSIENVRVLDNYDIFKKVGGFTATTETFTTNVSNGTLNIDFSAKKKDGGIYRPEVTAIEILSNSNTSIVRSNLPVSGMPVNNYLSKVFPNPTSDGRFKVLLPEEPEGELSYSLVSVSGQELIKGTLSLIRPTPVLEFDFSRQMQRAGMYYLKLKNKGGEMVFKLMRVNP